VDGAVILDDRNGDERNYIISPQIYFSSAGVGDQLELTIAPALNYDDLNNTTDIDWDFRVREEKQLTSNWSLILGDGFFLGDDPVLENELQTAEIVPETIRIQELEVVGAPAEDENTALTERYGRRRVWTKDFLVSTEYTFAEASTVGIGYNYGVLRNEGDGADVYAEYDRHDVFGNLGYRFNPTWRLDNQARYSKGLFDEEQELAIITDNGVIQNRNLGDLDEYQFQTRLNYIQSPHLQYFGEYRYQGVDYEDDAQEDYDIHELLVGSDYDFSSHLRLTLSGGVEIGSFENSPTDTDYSLYGGLEWDVERGTLALIAEKGYSRDNFDGRRSGLSEFWRTGTSFSYQITENMQSQVSANYYNYDRIQALELAPEETLSTPEFGQTLYTEKSYDAGITLSYTFARWYQLAGGYRYYENESDLQNDIYGNYNEHRFFVELSWGKELFRW
jgi:hypothetical protein